MHHILITIGSQAEPWNIGWCLWTVDVYDVDSTLMFALDLQPKLNNF